MQRNKTIVAQSEMSPKRYFIFAEKKTKELEDFKEIEVEVTDNDVIPVRKIFRKLTQQEKDAVKEMHLERLRSY